MIVRTSLLTAVLSLTAIGAVLPVQANPSSSAPLRLAQAGRTPEQTYMTPQNSNEIAVQISDGEFFFHDILHRTYGSFFTATDGSVRVTYNRDTGNVLVINNVTGTEFYNYLFSEAASGSDTYTPSHSYTPGMPVTTITPVNRDQFNADIRDGEFVFSGLLYRTSDTIFIGGDRQVRVIYNLADSHITVINVVTGTEFYNYTFSSVNEGAL